jgi:hypothetical protein
MRRRHPKKEIEAVLKHAEENGFTVLVGRAHWGILHCPGTRTDHCIPRSISGTPRSPVVHASDLHRYVEKCPHK